MLNGPRFLRALATTAAQSATAYGYTLTVWASGAALVQVLGAPGVGEAFLFVGGAVIAFASVEAVATRGFRQFDRLQEQRGLMVAGALHGLSAGAGVGSATLIAVVLESTLAWPLGAFLATALYLVLSAVQLSLASGDSSG